MEENYFKYNLRFVLKELSTKRGMMFSFLCFVIFLLAVYSNHFENGFHFDDSHTIVNNAYIRDLKNIPLFFTDATTVSSLPANQAWRPLMPTFFAIDYKLAGGLNPFIFHVTTILWYILQLLLMYFIFKQIFKFSCLCQWHKLTALFTVAWFGVHTANAETINYFSARSDSISTCFLVISLFLFIRFPKTQRNFLYLLPLICGAMVKQAVLVYPGILFMYIWLFEYQLSLPDLFLFKRNWIRIKQVLVLVIPSLLVCVIMFYLQAKLTPPTFTPGGTSVYSYLITQPFVILHYFRTFFLPTSLSADTDWSTLEGISDWRFSVGFLFLCGLIWLIFIASKRRNLRPVAFGLSWFLIALVPSSSVIPFAEVMNDHRIFFPYIGLVLASVTCLYLFIERMRHKLFVDHKLTISSCIVLFILFANGLGTRARNKIWHDDESLWYDVTVTSPNNGRGLMNYGLTQMSKGNYPEAEKYFALGLKRWPYYSYLYINMAILKNAMGDKMAAEDNFRKGLQFGSGVPEHHYFYAYYLYNNGRKDEAKDQLTTTITLAPANNNARYLLMKIYEENYEWEKLKDLANNTLSIIPGDVVSKQYLDKSINKKTKSQEMLETVQSKPTADGYLQLSLYYYNEGNYNQCIDACYKALKLDPKMAAAYNNICSAYNMLGNWNEAEKACQQAIAIKPDYQLAKNNLADITGRKNRISGFLSTLKSKPTAEGYLNLSLEYYNAGMYEKCIDACREAIKLKPDFSEAYNNICSSYNQLKQWDKAIEACDKALEFKPGYELAKNNRAIAIKAKVS